MKTFSVSYYKLFTCYYLSENSIFSDYILQESLIILSQFALCKKFIINETTNIVDKPKENFGRRKGFCQDLYATRLTDKQELNNGFLGSQNKILAKLNDNEMQLCDSPFKIEKMA